MGEIADMMLDGTMDPETGEWNFDGEDGPGWSMTGAEAAAFKRATGWLGGRIDQSPVYKIAKKLRKQIEAFGELVNHDAYHWQVRKDRRVIADWWPHKSKWRCAGKTETGDPKAFIKALGAAIEAEGRS